MLVRRAFYRWMVPAAFVLPLWLLVGWGLFSGGGLAFVWVVFLGVPSVFLGELALTLLVRARGTVRAERAVGGWDVVGIGTWHVLTIAVGLYNPLFFAPALALAVIAAVGLFWLALRELLREARPSAVLRRAADGMLYVAPPVADARGRTDPDGREVIVVRETRGPTA